jgi:hypothetical protein
MNIKTLLLGTATAFAAVTGAQAADLAVAEPVDYVKVCDAYGAGYFYIPGSDTCLKIGGYIKFMANFYENSTDNNGLDDRSWSWMTETSVNVTAQSMTDIGLLTGWIDYRAQRANGNDGHAYIDSAYLKAGPLKAGFFTNVYYYGGQFGEYGAGGGLDAADNSDNQVVFSTSMGGLGLWLGLADPSSHNVRYGADDTYNGNWPDVIAAITGTAGGFDWKLAGAVTDTFGGTGWGVQAGATWTAASGDAIRVKAAVGNDYGAYYVDDNIGGRHQPSSGDTIWSALIAGVHYWSSNLQTDVAASYTSNCYNRYNSTCGIWNVGVETDWQVAKNFLTGVAVDYFSEDMNSGSGESNGKWQVQLLAKRSF